MRAQPRRAAVLTAAAATALLGVAACGSSSSSSSSSATTSISAAAAGGSVVSGAQKLSSVLDSGFVYSATDTPTSPTQIEPYGSWRGPTTAPTPPSSATVEVIVCTKQSTACNEAAAGVQAAGKVLGWNVDVIDGGGTVQGYDQAFDTAFSRNPSAIVGVAVPTLQVGDKLTQAKQKGIVTVAVGDIPPTGGQTPYDAYVSFRMPLMESMLAYHEIAATSGHANTIVVEDPGYPSLVQAMGQYIDVMKTCSGCSTHPVQWQITDTADASKVNAIISGALAQDPNANAITLPYSLGLPAVISTLQAAGKAGQVAVLVKDGDQVGLQAVQQGGAVADAGSSATWAGWASMDQIIRGLAKAPYLTPDQIGLGVAYFDKTNVPPSGNIDDYSQIPNFAKAYTSAWGKG